LENEATMLFSCDKYIKRSSNNQPSRENLRHFIEEKPQQHTRCYCGL